MAHVRPRWRERHWRSNLEHADLPPYLATKARGRGATGGHLFWDSTEMKLTEQKQSKAKPSREPTKKSTDRSRQAPRETKAMPTTGSPKSRTKISPRKVTSGGSGRPARLRLQGTVTCAGQKGTRSTPREGETRQESRLEVAELTSLSGGTAGNDNASRTGPVELEDDEDEMMNEALDENQVQAGVFEGEEMLDHEHPDVDWAAFEERFKTTQMMLAFTIDEPTVYVESLGSVGILELASGIVQVCGSHGVCFADELVQTSEPAEELIATPKVKNRALWKFLRKGYIKVHGITVWVEPYSPDRGSTNLDILTIDYVNPEAVSVPDLHKLLQRWGALEGIAVSHGPKQGRALKLPAITCMTSAVRHPRTNERGYAFRLLFESEVTVNQVFKAWLARDWEAMRDVPHARTITLRPVKDVLWDVDRRIMVRPRATAEMTRMECRLHIYGVQPEMKAVTIIAALENLGFDGLRITLPPGRRSGNVDLKNRTDADKLYELFNVKQSMRLVIGNIRMFVNRTSPDGRHLCFDCDKPGHFQRHCPQYAHGGWAPRYSRQDQGPHYHGRDHGRGRGAARMPRGYRHGREDSYGQRADQAQDPQALTLRERLEDARGARTNALATREMVPMIRSLIADEVREQSQAVLRGVRQELARHASDVDSKITAHDTAIADIQATQKETTSDIKSLLLQLGQYLNIPNFGRGSLESGTDSRE